MARLVVRRRSSRPKALVRSGSPVLPWDPIHSVLRKILPSVNSCDEADIVF